MEKLIFPGHIGKLEYILPALQVYVEAGEWVKTADYIEREFDILKRNGIETEMKEDKTDYTKDAELPRYFGFVERQIPGNVKSDCRITDLGKLFYYAVKENDQDRINETIMTAIETVTFGKNNDGCPGSNTKLEVPNILLIASTILDGISRQEYAGVLYEMLNNNATITTALIKIKMLRDAGSPINNTVRVDNKVVPFLVNINFLEEDDGKIKLSDRVKQTYRERISQLPPTNDLENLFPDTVEDDGLANIDTLQQIYYGAPGTGKSFQIDTCTNEKNRIRTTFHPDYDYATFVGAYKPTVKTVDKYGLFGKDTVMMKHEDNTPIKEDVIVYQFIPQTFIKAYVEAWRRYADAECTDKDFYLVIEEINRGNCAQIFGDLFQLLDRTNAGFSSYAVETESDLQGFLTNDEIYKLNIVLTEDIKNNNGKVIATAENVMNGKVLVLPPNLHIWATMNTSDQSLFPIDSAFKRRWDWKYVPIKYDNTDWKVVLENKEVCKWTVLQHTLNNLIYDATESEDKMLGDWFVKADGKNEINEDQLVGKIIFYLWNDVAKVDAGKLFDLEVEKHNKKRKVIFSDFYTVDGKVDSSVVNEWLKNIQVLKNETAKDENPNKPEQ